MVELTTVANHLHHGEIHPVSVHRPTTSRPKTPMLLCPVTNSELGQMETGLQKDLRVP